MQAIQTERNVPFRVFAVGTRVDRVSSIFNEIMKYHGIQCCWIAPDHRRARQIYRALKALLTNNGLYDFNDAALRIEANHGRSFEIFTASNPDALRGGQWDYAVFDDPARMPKSIWTQFVWPCLPLHGQADFIGIPQGIHNSDGTENWFHRIFQQGLDPFLPDWMSSILPTTSSPEVLQEMIEEARKNLPELVFRQEYLAEFIDPQEK